MKLVAPYFLHFYYISSEQREQQHILQSFRTQECV